MISLAQSPVLNTKIATSTYNEITLVVERKRKATYKYKMNPECLE